MAAVIDAEHARPPRGQRIAFTNKESDHGDRFSNLERFGQI